jgi:LuxR family transcriptional regulator
MATWQDDLFSLALSDGSEQEIFDRVALFAKEIGFDFCAYGLQMPIPVSSPKVFMVNNYANAWRQQYANAGYLAIDPTVQHGRTSMSPISWSSRDQKGHRDFWDDAVAHDISYGWCQSSFTRTGIGGLLTLSRSSEPITVDELTHKEIQLRWLVSVTHESMAQRQVGRLNNLNPVQLSARETEILRWTADGKSAQEIADILHVTKHTIEFHIKNATYKLQAVNKTAAVVKALVLGLLS